MIIPMTINKLESLAGSKTPGRGETSGPDPKAEGFDAIFSAPLFVPAGNTAIKPGKAEPTCTKVEGEPVNTKPATIEKTSTEVPAEPKEIGALIKESGLVKDPGLSDAVKTEPSQNVPPAVLSSNDAPRLAASIKGFDLQIMSDRRTITDVAVDETTNSLRLKLAPPLGGLALYGASADQLAVASRTVPTLKLDLAVAGTARSPESEPAPTKGDAGKQTDFVQEIASTPKNDQPAQHQSFDQGKQDPGVQKEALKTGAMIGQSDVAAGGLFKSLLDPPQTVQKVAVNGTEPAMIVEQLEPAIMQLAELSRAASEPKILKMKLNPAELGAVEIMIVKSSSGKINAHFQTENERTREILNAGLANLRTSLESTGSQVGEIKISCGMSSPDADTRHRAPSKDFGNAENNGIGNAVSDPDQRDEGDQQDRLVNLRA